MTKHNTVTFTDEPMEYTNPPKTWPFDKNMSYNENQPS
nr:MAG TPA: hypothetical protein [Caudoviricetes sp.]